MPAGSEGLVMLPYFVGEKTPLHDPHARSTLVGLGLHQSLAHMWRAELERVVFGFHHHETFSSLQTQAKRNEET